MSRAEFFRELQDLFGPIDIATGGSEASYIDRDIDRDGDRTDTINVDTEDGEQHSCSLVELNQLVGSQVASSYNHYSHGYSYSASAQASLTRPGSMNSQFAAYLIQNKKVKPGGGGECGGGGGESYTDEECKATFAGTTASATASGEEQEHSQSRDRDLDLPLLTLEESCALEKQLYRMRPDMHNYVHVDANAHVVFNEMGSGLADEGEEEDEDNVGGIDGKDGIDCRDGMDVAKTEKAEEKPADEDEDCGIDGVDVDKTKKGKDVCNTRNAKSGNNKNKNNSKKKSKRSKRRIGEEESYFECVDRLRDTIQSPHFIDRGVTYSLLHPAEQHPLLSLNANLVAGCKNI